jgi:hypothetical protein
MNNLFTLPKERRAIKPIGHVWIPNEDGYIVNDFGTSNVTEEASHAINFFVMMATKFFADRLQSIYITGSTVTGIEYPTTDIIRRNRNFVIVVSENAFRSQKQKFVHEVVTKSQFQFDVPIIYESELYTPENFPEFEQVFSSCVYGNDIATKKYLFDDIIFNKDTQYMSDMRDAIQFYSDLESYSLLSRRSNIQYFCKKILRYGMLKAAPHVRKYSRDLYYCTKFYMNAFPEHEKVMFDILNLYLNPDDTKPNLFELAIDTL